MKGTKVIIEALRSEGVDLAFAYPGGQVIPLFDELYNCRDIRIILPRHEQAGAHAAEGYARATGRVGVVIATSGPGATNLVTGLADAHMDSVPLVAITGQVKSSLIGYDAFQEVDVVGITRSISKHNYLASNPEELPFILKAAFHIAKTGRPGPVVVDIPSDVQNSDIKARIPARVSIPSYQPNYEGNPRQVDKVSAVINAAQRPVIYAGGGVISSGAHELILQAAEKSNIPVTTTLMGLGCFPSGHPLSLGMLGMHGTAYANRAVMASDLLIAVGARFDDRVTGKLSAFAAGAKIIHIDIDPTSVSKNVKADYPVIGCARNVLEQLVPKLDSAGRREWLEQIRMWKENFPLDYSGSGLRPQRILHALETAVGDRDAVLCTDVGQHQMWSALYWNHRKPRNWISSGGLGTMGFGLPAAIGAQLGRPGSLVILVTGDGSIQMNIQELATVKRLDLPIKIIIMNNGCLGMVRQWQQLFWRKRYSHTDISDNPDFARVAEAYGIRAVRIDDEGSAAEMAKALLNPGPVLVDASIAREDNVYPMVAAGEALDNIIMSGG